MRSLGLLSSSIEASKMNTVLDACSKLFENKMQYKEGERDMIVMHHIFGVELADGSQQTRTSTMIEYGTPGGYSAMAKTVGLPTAIATKLVLDKKITRQGILSPMTRDIYEP